MRMHNMPPIQHQYWTNRHSRKDLPHHSQAQQQLHHYDKHGRNLTQRIHQQNRQTGVYIKTDPLKTNHWSTVLYHQQPSSHNQANCNTLPDHFYDKPQL